jgi:hypothetical protein
MLHVFTSCAIAAVQSFRFDLIFQPGGSFDFSVSRGFLFALWSRELFVALLLVLSAISAAVWLALPRKRVPHSEDCDPVDLDKSLKQFQEK